MPSKLAFFKRCIKPDFAADMDRAIQITAAARNQSPAQLRANMLARRAQQDALATKLVDDVLTCTAEAALIARFDRLHTNDLYDRLEAIKASR